MVGDTETKLFSKRALATLSNACLAVFLHRGFTYFTHIFCDFSVLSVYKVRLLMTNCLSCTRFKWQRHSQIAGKQ